MALAADGMLQAGIEPGSAREPSLLGCWDCDELGSCWSVMGLQCAGARDSTRQVDRSRWNPTLDQESNRCGPGLARRQIAPSPAPAGKQVLFTPTLVVAHCCGSRSLLIADFFAACTAKGIGILHGQHRAPELRLRSRASIWRSPILTPRRQPRRIALSAPYVRPLWRPRTAGH